MKTRMMGAILVGVVLAAAEGSARAATNTWVDRFDAETFDARWGKDEPNPSVGTVSLDTTNDCARFEAFGDINMWSARKDAPILWTSSPSGDFAFETHVVMSTNQGGAVAAVTVYDADGERPDFTFGLDHWNVNNRMVKLQGLGDNDPLAYVPATEGEAWLELVVARGAGAGGVDRYECRYKLAAASDWTVLATYDADIPNARIGLAFKANGTGKVAEFSYAGIGVMTTGGIAAGDVVKLDFSTAGDGDGGSLADWNQVGATGTPLAAGNVVRHGDAAIIQGVAISFANFVAGHANNDVNAADWAGTAADPYYVAAADDIYYHGSADTFSAVFSGLNADLRYNVRVYSLIGSSSGSTERFVVTDGDGTRTVENTRGDRWNAATLEAAGTVFAGLAVNAADEVVVSVEDVSTVYYPLNAIVLEAVEAAPQPPEPPTLSACPVQVVEGDAGITTAVFRVELSHAHTTEVAFTYHTVDGSAVAPGDYTAFSNGGFITAGETVREIPVSINGDTLDEPDEFFILSIDSATPVEIERQTARAVIFSDERDQYLTPSTLAADTARNRLYVGHASASHVSVVDLETDALFGVIELPALPSGLALSPDARVLYVTTGVASGMLHAVDAETLEVTHSIGVGHSPRAPVCTSTSRVYVCNQFENQVSIIDGPTQAVVDRIPVRHEPFASGLTPDRSTLFIANLLPHQVSTDTNVSASISVIDTATDTVSRHIALPPGSHSVRRVVVSPDGRYACVTHVLSRYRIPTTQIFRGWINTAALSIVDVASLNRVNTILLDDLDLGAANPWGLAFTADGGHLCVTHAGSHELSVIDWPALTTRLASESGDLSSSLTWLAGLRRRLPLPGKGPRGVAVVGGKAYVAESFSDSLAIAHLALGGEYDTETLILGWPKPMTTERRGESYFFDGALSAQSWHSCISCHPGGRTDGLNWDLLNDGFGNAKNTKSLLFAHETPPTTITGIRPNADTSVMAGFRFIHFVNHTEDKLVAVNAFLKAQRPVPSPELEAGGLSAVARRGETLFTSTGCIQCHNGPYLTDRSLYDVGTGTGREAGTRFDTPSLVEIWRTAPYLYDGRAATLREVLTTFNPEDRHGLTSGLTPQQLDDLEAYVRSL